MEQRTKMNLLIACGGVLVGGLLGGGTVGYGNRIRINVVLNELMWLNRNKKSVNCKVRAGLSLQTNLLIRGRVVALHLINQIIQRVRREWWLVTKII